jgi:hypothetical protein
MTQSRLVGLTIAVATSLVVSGCYTQFESTQDDLASDDVTYAEPDSADAGAGSTESYEDARYRFVLYAGYPYWFPGISFSFWDPYPFDPWFWGPPATWYPYGAYYTSWWYYPPAAYYPPGYWYYPPATVYAAGYTNRDFGSTRGGYGMSRGNGSYRGASGVSSVMPVSGSRAASTRLGRPSSGASVQGRTAATPSAVDRPASTRPSVRQGSGSSRKSAPAVRPAPPQRRADDPGTQQSVAPQRPTQRSSDGGAVRPQSGNSGGSRSYSSPPSSAPPSRPSGPSRSSSPSGGASGSQRTGGRR